MDIQFKSQSIFFQQDLSTSITTYLKLIAEVNGIIEKPISQDYKGAIQILEQISCLSNQDLYHGMLRGAAERFSRAATIEKRERLLLSYLGLILCYYYLGEVCAIRQIQEFVSRQKFSRSFWEKYKGDITEGAMMLLGVAMSIAGGGSAGVGGAVGGQTGNKENERMKQELERREAIFNQLRNAMLGLQF